MELTQAKHVDVNSLVLAAISASGMSYSEPLPFEYEYDEASEVLESLQATGVTPAKLLGDLAQTSVSTTISFTGTLTSGAATVGSPSSTTGLLTGQTISGAGIPAGTTISVSGGVVTLSQAATASGTAVALTVTVETQVIAMSEWTIDFKRKTAEATTTDDATWESSLGSTKSWSVKAKFMFISGDASQSQSILAAITTVQSATLWNFFPTIAVGREAWQGLAYVDGITLATGMGKVVGLDVSLKGTGPLNQVTQLAPVAVTNTVTGLQAED